MKGSARIIALCGICGAISSVCLLLTSLLPYAALIFGVFASVATVVPLLIDGKNLRFSLLVYAVTVVIGAVGGVFIGNPVAVAPVLFFCVPFCIVKVYGESVKLTANVEGTQTVNDPFDDEETQVIQMRVNTKRRLPVWLKWLLYYALLEIGLVLTFLFTWLLTPAVFERLYSNRLVFGLIVAVAQVAVPLYDLLLRGCLIAASKVVRKIYR